MIINITTPIIVDGNFVAEFEGAVEVTITHRGTGPSFDYPGDAPEWEVEDYFVDTGSFQKLSSGGHAWRSNLLPCPDGLKGYLSDYLDTTEGRDSVILTLQEYGEVA